MGNIGLIIFLISPIILGFLAWIFLKKSKIDLLIKILLVISIVLIIDFIFRTFSKGSIDSEGNGWLLLISWSCILTSFIAILIYGISKRYFFKTIIGLIISAIITFLYYSFFSTYGLSWEAPSCNDINESKKDNRFISLLVFDDNEFNYKSDTVKLKYGWIEKSILIDNSGIIKKRIETTKYNLIIKLDGKFNENSPFRRIYYKIDNPNVSGASPIDNIITFGVNDIKDTILLYFFKDEDDNVKNFKLIKEIKTVANTGYTQCGL